jgi:hypothetical protein
LKDCLSQIRVLDVVNAAYPCALYRS